MARIHTNERAGRAHALLWSFALVTIVGLVLAATGSSESGLILAGVALPATAALDFFCRRYVTTLVRVAELDL